MSEKKVKERENERERERERERYIKKEERVSSSKALPFLRFLWF